MQRHSPHLLFSLLLLTVGCSTGTDPGPCEEMVCRRITDLMIVERGVFPFGDSLRSFFEMKGVFGQDPGVADGFYINGLLGGDDIYSVELNGFELSRISLAPDSPGYYYRSREAHEDSILAPPGDWNQWFVRIGFSDSAYFRFRTPSSRAELTTSPTYVDDTLSTDQDLQISWPPGSPLGEERNFVVVLLQGDNGTQTIAYSSQENFFFTDQNETVIHRDSLKTWSTRFHSMQIQLEHFSIRDTALTESSWARTVLQDLDARILHFPAR